MPRRATPHRNWGGFRGPTGRPPRTYKPPTYPKWDTPRHRYDQLSKGRIRKINDQIRSARGGQQTAKQPQSLLPKTPQTPLSWWLNLPLNPWKKFIKPPQPPPVIPGRRFRNIQSY